MQSGDDERVIAEASEWIVLGDERPLTDEELAAFQQWKSRDPHHAGIYSRLLRTWDSVGTLDAEALRNAARPTVIPFPQARAGRRWLWPSLAAAAAAVLIAFLTLPIFNATDRYETRVAELRQLRLPDGSLATLGPKSRIKVAFAGKVRRVELAGGEAFFEVVKDPSRPFEVDAGGSIVRVLGTKFDVNRSDRGVRISVLEGVVKVRQVDAKHADTASVELRAGQRTEVAVGNGSSDHRPGPGARALPVMAAPAAGSWREGRLVYENVRLGDLIDDMNRYYGPGITLDGNAASDTRLTVALKTSEVRAFMSGLSAIAPVKVQGRADGGYVVHPAQ